MVSAVEINNELRKTEEVGKTLCLLLVLEIAALGAGEATN